MKSIRLLTCFFLVLSLFVTKNAQACCSDENCANYGTTPPFGHTCDMKDAISAQNHKSEFTGLRYTGDAYDDMWNGPNGVWDKNVPVHVFSASFSEGYVITVNCDFNAGSVQYCQSKAEIALTAIGRIPAFARYKVNELEIRPGDWGLWGGGGMINMLIETAKTEDECLEEVFMHECGHNTIDPLAYGNEIWNCARDADRNYITTYGRDHPFREDAAESLVAYYAWWANTVPADIRAKIEATMPNRLQAIPKLIWGKEFVPDNSTVQHQLAGLHCTLEKYEK